MPSGGTLLICASRWQLTTLSEDVSVGRAIYHQYTSASNVNSYPSWFAYVSETEDCLLEDVLITPVCQSIPRCHLIRVVFQLTY